LQSWNLELLFVSLSLNVKNPLELCPQLAPGGNFEAMADEAFIATTRATTAATTANKMMRLIDATSFPLATSIRLLLPLLMTKSSEDVKWWPRKEA
jgi:hypothetical protein